MRILPLILLAIPLASCAIQRAQVAHDAQDKMVGLKKEQVLACMGPPAAKAAEGATEVWSYNSGDGTVVGGSTVSLSGNQNSVFGSGFGSSSRRFCTVNIVMASGAVSAVRYNGPTGGLLTGGEQCAFAVQNCTQ